jgi:acetoin utilization deacetylase AcuC-like enzyme
VLYFSIHRYDHGRFWPEKKYSDFDFVGKEEGEGFNINVAWNKVFIYILKNKKTKFIICDYHPDNHF